jgi:hypothetical protein
MDQTMGEREWHYVKDGQQHGPVSESELIGLFRDRTLAPETQVWTQQLKDWCKASEIDWLLSATGPPSRTMPVAEPYQGAERPAAVTVFGILNIVFGALGLLSMPCALFFMFAMPGKVMNPTRAVKAWLLFSSLIGFVATILLIITGIGLLNLKAWARKWAVGYGWFAIIWGVLGTIMNLILMTSGAYGYSQDAAPGAMGGMIGGTIGGLFGLIYPILLIVFMQRPNVKNACTR